MSLQARLQAAELARLRAEHAALRAACEALRAALLNQPCRECIGAPANLCDEHADDFTAALRRAKDALAQARPQP